MLAEPKLICSSRSVSRSVERVVQRDTLIVKADIAAQIPATEVSPTGRWRIMRGGGTMAMSAANATDDNRDAAPAATRNLTLRIGFVLLFR